MQRSIEICPTDMCFYLDCVTAYHSYTELLHSHLLVVMDNFAVNKVTVNENIRRFTRLIKIYEPVRSLECRG